MPPALHVPRSLHQLDQQVQDTHVVFAKVEPSCGLPPSHCSPPSSLSSSFAFPFLPFLNVSLYYASMHRRYRLLSAECRAASGSNSPSSKCDGSVVSRAHTPRGIPQPITQCRARPSGAEALVTRRGLLQPIDTHMPLVSIVCGFQVFVSTKIECGFQVLGLRQPSPHRGLLPSRVVRTMRVHPNARTVLCF